VPVGHIIGKGAAIILKESRKPKPGEKLSENMILDSIENQIKVGNLPESEKICPECGRKFSLISVADLQLECCVFCKSLWFDQGELKSLTNLIRDIPADHLAHRKSRLNCPVCQIRMREYLFLSKQNLLVDKCPDEHGIYLESNELKRIFELIK